MKPIAEFFDHFLPFAAYVGEIVFMFLLLAPLLLGALCALIWLIVGPGSGSGPSRNRSGSPLLWLIASRLLGHWSDDDCE